MTDQTLPAGQTQRVTDDDVRHVADQLKHDLDEARALAQSQAATIAELRDEVANLTSDVDAALKAVTLENEARTAAESALAQSLAATIAEREAEIERLTKSADEAIAGLSNARDQYRRASRENHQRAVAAESALATVIARNEKLEAVAKRAGLLLEHIKRIAFRDAAQMRLDERNPFVDELIVSLNALAALKEDKPHG